MTEKVTLRLEEQLCFALYAASRAMTARYRPLLKPFGLTYPQYLVLLALWDAGEPRTVSQLGDTLRLDSGTLSPLLHRLEATEYVRRERQPGDERAVYIALTDAGRALRARTKHIPKLILDVAGRDDAARVRDDLWQLEGRLRPQF